MAIPVDAQLAVDTSGKVGIGTPAPGADLGMAARNPEIVGSVTDTRLNCPRSVCVSGSYAYVAVYKADRLTVVDVSKPAGPVVVGSVSGTNLEGAFSVVVSGRYDYVAAYDAGCLTVVDISNPNLPVVAGSVAHPDFDSPSSVCVSGRYAYVTDYVADQLSVVDVSEPTNPAVVIPGGAVYNPGVDKIAGFRLFREFFNQKM